MEEDKKNIDVSKSNPKVFPGGKKPLGVLILGGINFFVFGIVSFIFFFFVYQNIPSLTNHTMLEDSSQGIVSSTSQGIVSSTSQRLFEDAKRFFPEGDLSWSQFKAAVILQIAIALFFSISGLGLLLRKEKARRLTLYFSFFMVALALISVLFNPSTITQAILQIIYPGILIFYFTNKRVESYFLHSSLRPPLRGQRPFKPT